MWLLIGIWSENITTKIRFEPFYSIKVDSVCGFLKKFWHCCRTLCCYKMYAYCPNFTSPTFFHFIKNSEFWLHSLTEKIMAKSKIFKIATGSKVALKVYLIFHGLYQFRILKVLSILHLSLLHQKNLVTLVRRRLQRVSKSRWVRSITKRLGLWSESCFVSC